MPRIIPGGIPLTNNKEITLGISGDVFDGNATTISKKKSLSAGIS